MQARGRETLELRGQAIVAPPVGLEGIIETFGDIRTYIGADGTLDPQWPAEILELVQLPFPLRLAWALQTEIREFRCHRELVDVFRDVFERLLEEGLTAQVKTFGGCYAFRAKRGATRLSTHSWGIAVDLNPESNALGTRGDMDPRVVEVFRHAGFVWGGEWARADAMHFQYCSGY